MYSIWLLPSEKASNRFHKIISNLSESFKTPAFEPHITLLAFVPKLTDEMYYKISILAALTDEFELSLDNIEMTEAYFKSLFITLKDNSTLFKVQQEVQDLFAGIKYKFHPHLSLLYGQSDVAAKQSCVDEIRPQLTSHFKVSQIAIVKTTTDINSWKIIESFNLNEVQNPHLDFIIKTVENLKI